MITAKIEAVGLMRLPYDPAHYLNALAPQSFARLLKAIEPDAREVRMNPAPGDDDEAHILWKVKTEVRRMGEFVARERGRPSDEGIGFRTSTAKITWVQSKKRNYELDEQFSRTTD